MMLDHAKTLTGKKLILPVVLLSFFLSAKAENTNVVHIDPGNRNDPAEDGSQAHPYDSWEDVKWKNGWTYLLKRGTTIEAGKITIKAKKVTLDAYGFGEMPVIRAKENTDHVFHIHNKKRVSITNLEIVGNNTVSCIYFQGNRNTNSRVKNCVLRNAFNGVRVIGRAHKISILDCEIREILDDGIFAKNIRQIEIDHCIIRNVNLNWHQDRDEVGSSGDCIQIESNRNLKYRISFNQLDHSSTGNKFCLIIQGKNASGDISGNHFIGNAEENNSCLYIGHQSKNVSISNNIFQYGAFGLYNRCEDVNIEYNIFKNNLVAVSMMENTMGNMYNNLFEENDFLVDAYLNTTLNLFNNIFLIREGKEYAFEFRSENVSHDYNLYSRKPSYIKIGKNSIIGEPGFREGTYFLLPDSPCINSGKNIGKERDYFGNEITPQDQKDIGIHEYTQ